jgi:hypothetical protein
MARKHGRRGLRQRPVEGLDNKEVNNHISCCCKHGDYCRFSACFRTLQLLTTAGTYLTQIPETSPDVFIQKSEEKLLRVIPVNKVFSLALQLRFGTQSPVPVLCLNYLRYRGRPNWVRNFSPQYLRVAKWALSYADSTHFMYHRVIFWR